MRKSKAGSSPRYSQDLQWGGRVDEEGEEQQQQSQQQFRARATLVGEEKAPRAESKAAGERQERALEQQKSSWTRCTDGQTQPGCAESESNCQHPALSGGGERKHSRHTAQEQRSCVAGAETADSAADTVAEWAFWYWVDCCACVCVCVSVMVL